VAKATKGIGKKQKRNSPTISGSASSTLTVDEQNKNYALFHLLASKKKS
jgi:hypothetical protein